MELPLISQTNMTTMKQKLREAKAKEPTEDITAYIQALEEILGRKREQHAKAMRKYYEKSESFREKQHERAIRRRERMKESQKKKPNMTDNVKEYMKNYYAKNKETILGKMECPNCGRFISKCHMSKHRKRAICASQNNI